MTRVHCTWAGLAACVAVLATLAACDANDPMIDEGPSDANVLFSGGDTTIFDESSHAFSNPAPNLLEERLRGDADFEAVFVTAPALINTGLGPVFNSASCVFCHPRDGRAPAPKEGSDLGSLLLRLSVPSDAPAGGPPTPVPGFGDQLNNHGVIGVQGEALVLVAYTDVVVDTNDGSVIQLRMPSFTIIDAYKPLPTDVQVSPRMPRPVFGLGLLEAIDEDTILSLADERDLDEDGITGRPNYVLNVETGSYDLGRFGWKANQPNLRQQTAAAYNGDMGLTTTLYPSGSARGQTQDDSQEDDPEIPDAVLDAVTFYVRTLAVPARRRTDDPVVLAGERLFHEAKCAACHTPKLNTSTLTDTPEVSDQTIYPYTDMLLHDMGPELADNRDDFRATGSEWRTPPLWGVGLTQTVNGHMNMLHDGRARSLIEAIFWHGGEAQASRDYVQALPRSDRDALLAFVMSL